MRHLPIALLAVLIACEGNDVLDSDSPFDKQGRVCLTTPSCNDAKLLRLGDLPEDPTGSDQRIALVGEDIFVAYRANTTLHFAQWHAGAWKALPSVTVPTQPYSYDFVVVSSSELYLLQQSRGATSVSPFDGAAF
ncbi:MAG: hypothetical protein H7Z43_04185, partial [Clostridia bacterium]|nr:hypothetical protein [Deltaproteobacteria bacterium]